MTTNLEIPGEFTTTGLKIRDGLSRDEWLKGWAQLKKVSGVVQWAMGDWLAYGERNYGEEIAQALDDDDYDYKTLTNWKYVAGKVDTSRRRESVSFSKHAEVAPLDPEDQDRVLEKAEKENLTVRQVRDEVKAIRGTKTDDPNKSIRDSIDLINKEVAKLPAPETAALACLDMRGFDYTSAHLLSLWFTKFSLELNKASKREESNIRLVK